jgi:hypothetical protein
MTKRVLGAFLIVGTALALGGAMACLPLPPVGVVVVQIGPPPARWERMGPPPGPWYVWVGGYWVWRDGDFVWVVGRWMPIPPGHRYWVPGRWVRARRGWYFVEGYWD